MAQYNGHRSWNAWNVSLWVNNDEGLYKEARSLKQKYGTRGAARILLRTLPERTPDGGRYNMTCLVEALSD